MITLTFNIIPGKHEYLKSLLYLMAIRNDDSNLQYDGKRLKVTTEFYHIPGDDDFLLHQIMALLEYLGIEDEYAGISGTDVDPEYCKHLDKAIRKGLEKYDL